MATASVLRLLHVSDIHFGKPHRSEVSEGLLELAAEKRPDLFVISGDLTQRAKPREFRQARAFVDRLQVPWIAVPGNHDVPMYRFWERLLTPYGAYRKYFDPELEPVYRTEGVLVVGVNSAHGFTIDEGRVGVRRLRRLDAQLAAAPEGALKVVVIHHLLIPAPRVGRQKVLVNAEETVEVLVRHQVDLVLSGHYHQSFFGTSEEFYPSGRRPVPLIYAGTGSSTRGRAEERGQCACNWIELAPDCLELTVLRWRPEGDRFTPHSTFRLGDFEPAAGAPVPS